MISSRWVMMLGGCILVLGGCATAQQQETLAAVQRIKAELAQLNDRCKAMLDSRDLDPIRDKVELDRTDWSTPTPFSMLTNHNKPTASERQAIAKWGSIRDMCQSAVVQYSADCDDPIHLLANSQGTNDQCRRELGDRQ
jgi:hypothetical protein